MHALLVVAPLVRVCTQNHNFWVIPWSFSRVQESTSLYFVIERVCHRWLTGHV